MPAKKGGKKGKRGKKGGGEPVKRILIIKEDGQEYASVSDLLGNCRMRLSCFDGVERIGIVRGKMRKRVWIAKGDIILVGTRDFQDDKVDIIHRYNPDEVRVLQKRGELPTNLTIVEQDVVIGSESDDDLFMSNEPIDIDDI